jgi:hypothetical protein
MSRSKVKADTVLDSTLSIRISIKARRTQIQMKIDGRFMSDECLHVQLQVLACKMLPVLFWFHSVIYTSLPLYFTHPSDALVKRVFLRKDDLERYSSY